MPLSLEQLEQDYQTSRKGLKLEDLEADYQANLEVEKPELSAGRLGGVLAEGAKETIRSSIQALKGLAEAQVAGLKKSKYVTPPVFKPEKALEYIKPDIGLPHIFTSRDVERLTELAEHPSLQPSPEYQGPSSGWLEDLTRAAPQMGTQITATLLAGPLAGIGVMAAQIAGGTYESLRKEGVEPRRAIAAGIVNAAVQAPLEQIGVSKISKLWKPQKSLIKRLKNIGEAGFTEWLTEFVQSYPDAAANIWAKNPDKDLLQQTKQFFDEFWETTARGAYEGTLTAPWALLGLKGGIQKPSEVTPPPEPQFPYRHNAVLNQIRTDLETGKIYINDVIALKGNPDIQAMEIDDDLNKIIIEEQGKKLFVPEPELTYHIEEPELEIEIPEEEVTVVEPELTLPYRTQLEKAPETKLRKGELYRGVKPITEEELPPVYYKKGKKLIKRGAAEEMPVKESEEKPTASFLGWQETPEGDHVALYNVESGPDKGTTVTVGGLERKGIEIPETPEKPPPKKPPSEPKLKPTVEEKVEKGKPPVEEKKAPEAKEPWEMTREEFLKPIKAAAYRNKLTGEIIEGTPTEVHFEILERKNISFEEVGTKYEDGFVGRNGEFLTKDEAQKLVKRPDRKTQLTVHKEYVAQALSEGKSVPRHVLEEYKEEPWAEEALGEVPKPEKEVVEKKPIDKYLNEEINYGGEIRTRGSVIAEMQKAGTAQKQIDAYMMGAKTIPEKPISTPKPTAIEQRQKAMDKKYASLVGTKVKAEGKEWEFVGTNDIGHPYFSRVVKGKVQKKQFTLSEYGRDWLDRQLSEPIRKPKKEHLTILKDKKKLLADIDKAIEKAPESWEVAKVEEGIVHFDIDGGMNIINTKSTLKTFRQKVNATAENAPITKLPLPTKKAVLPKPTGKKPEISIEEERQFRKERNIREIFGIEPPLTVDDAAIRYMKEGNRGIDWAYDQMGEWEKEDFDQWLIESEHPLAKKAGTNENRFREIVKEYTEKVLTEPGYAKPPEKGEQISLEEAIEEKKKPPEGETRLAMEPALTAEPRGYEFTKQQQKDLIKIGTLIPQWLKRAGADEEVLKNITVELKPFIDLRGASPELLEKTLADWGKEGGIRVPVAATTLNNAHATIQLALHGRNLASLEQVTYHEWYHIAKRWMLPQSDINALTKHFKTEESEADAFAEYMKNTKTIQGKPSIVRRLFMKLKRMLSIIRNGLNGKGFTRPEDIFGKIRVRAYKPVRMGAVGLGTKLAMAPEEEVLAGMEPDKRQAALAEIINMARQINAKPEVKDSITKLEEATTKDLIEEGRDIYKEAKEKGYLNRRFGNDVIHDNDMKWYNRAFHLPYWLAKKYPSMKASVDIMLKRTEDRHAELFNDYNESELGRIQQDLPKNKAAMNEFRGLVWQWDNKRMPKKAVPTNWYKDFKPGDDIEIDPKHYEEVEAYLTKQNHSPEAIEAFLVVRKKLDQKFVDIDKTMRTEKLEPSLIEEYRSEIHKINNYFPHRRTGNTYIQIIDTQEEDPSKKVVYREHYNNFRDRWFTSLNEKAQGRTKAWIDNAIKEGRLPGLADRYEISQPRSVKELPQEIFFQIPVEAMQQVLGVAGRELERSRVSYEADRLFNKGEVKTRKEAIELARKRLRADMEKALSKAVAQTFKVKGWGRHAVLRKNIPGHETEDVFGILHDYLSGYAGFKTKIVAARQFSKILHEIDAKKRPNEWRYVSKYIQDMLANQDRTDRTVDGLRGLFFVKYLGFSIKSGMINLTQNVVVAAPVLSVHTKGAHRKVAKAMRDTRRALTAKEAWTGKEVKYPGLTSDEQQAIHQMIEAGTAMDLFLRELKGNLPGVGYGKYFRKAVDKSGIFMQLAEKFNRTSTGLAAYRIAKNEKGMSHDEAVDFAKGIIYDTHFLYGKANLPSAMRGGEFAKYLRATYTFRTFTHNYLHCMYDLFANQGWAGKKAFARGMRNLFLMGGLTSMPFFKALSEVFMWAMGDDDEDAISKIRKEIPSDYLRDLVTYGLPGVAGVDLTGSLSIEVPRNWKDILGVPYAGVEDTINTIRSYKAGQKIRTFGETPFTPIFVRNALRGLELYTKGQRARSGIDINYYGEVGPRKISGKEAVAKGVLGLQPVSVSKGYAAYKATAQMKKSIQERKTEWANRYVNAMKDKNQPEMEAVRKEVKEWNEQARKDNKLWRIINLGSAIKYRQRPTYKAVPKKMRGAAKGIAKTWKGPTLLNYGKEKRK